MFRLFCLSRAANEKCTEVNPHSLFALMSFLLLCTEMDCDQFKLESDADHTPEKV